MSAPDMERISAALFSIPPDDRDLWVRMGMAIKSELGDEGFDIWDAWSRQSDSYNSRDAKDVWRSINGAGRVTARTLFHEAKSYGWRDNGHQKPTPEEIEARRRQAAERTAKEKAKERSRHEAAAASAAEILAAATGDPAAHPYAVKKRVPFGPQVRRGLWPQRGWTDALLVPLYDGEGRLSAVEAINVDGDKDFLAGGKISGCFYPFGQVRGASRVLIGEGLASVAACVAAESSPAVAALCASNLKTVALAVRESAPEAHIILVADKDDTGLKAAKEAAAVIDGRLVVSALDGRKCDAWDLWNECGAEAVQRAIADAKAPDIEGTAEDLGATVRRLAGLSPLEYDRLRVGEAERLRVRVTTLDAAVEKLRREAGSEPDSQGDAVLFPEIEPWPEPVDGAKLLTDLASTCRRYAVLPRLADVAVALWILFAHAISAVNVAPILAITSPEKRCGKSTLLTLLARLVPRSLPASNISPAAVFRAIEAWAPTLLIDEADSFVRNNEELRGILNSGHTRDSAFVIRTVGDDHEPRRFSTWAAKVIALIGKLPDTLADRSIEIPLKRKLPSEPVEKLRHADPELFSNLARRCARWAADHVDEIRAARPSMPDALNDRAQDNWEGLAAIAGLAGGDWPKLTRKAALALSGITDAEDEGLRVQLLADIRDVFEKDKGERLTSEDLVGKLCAKEERPWGAANRGKPITANWLARRLKPFGVRPKQFWEGRKERGYELDDLKDPFARYLPPTSGRPGRTQAGCGPQPSSQPGMNPDPTDHEQGPKPSGDAGSTGPTTYERDAGGREDDPVGSGNRQDGAKPDSGSWETRL